MCVCMYNYVCVCTWQDQGNVSLSDVQILRISVTDVNDLDPFFEPPSYYAMVYENATQVSHNVLHCSSNPPWS